MAEVPDRLAELAQDCLALLGAVAVAVRVLDGDDLLQTAALAGRNAAALVAGPDEPAAPVRGRWRRREFAAPGEVESHPILGSTGRRLGWLTFERGVSAEPSSRLAETALRVVLELAAAVLEQGELSARVSAQDDLLLERLDQLRASEQALQVAFEESVVGMMMLSLDPAEPGRCLRANDALSRLTGHSRDELLSGDFERFTHPDDRGPTASAMRRAMAGRRTPFRIEKRLLRADGSDCWVRVTTSPLFDDDDRPLYALAQVEDLSQRAEREVEFAARLDPLTGTLNPAALEQGLVETVQRAHRVGTGCAVLVAELAGWQELAGGDEQLADDLQVALARRLQTTLRGSDVISRVGNNQFVIIAEEVGPEQAEAVAGRLEQALAVPEIIDGQEFPMTINLGLSVLSDGPGDDAGQSATLLAQARAALEQSRGSGSHVLYLSDGARPAVATSRTLYAHPEWRGRTGR